MKNKKQENRIISLEIFPKIDDLIYRGFRMEYKEDHRGTVYMIDEFVFLRRAGNKNKFQLWIKGNPLIDSDDESMYMSREDGELIYIYLQEKLKEQENNEEKQKFKSIKNYLNDIL